MELNNEKVAELRELLFRQVYAPVVVQKCAEYGLPIENEADFRKFAETVNELRSIRKAAVDCGMQANSKYDQIAGAAKEASAELGRIVPSAPQVDVTPLQAWLDKEAAVAREKLIVGKGPKNVAGDDKKTNPGAVIKKRQELLGELMQ